MSRPEQFAAALQSHRAAFKAFLAGRVGNDADAEDILQNGLLKALRRADEVKDPGRIVAWFYQLLRHAVIDHYRTRAAGRRRDDSLATTVASLGEDVAAAPRGWEAHLCTCLGDVVGTLKPPHAELLRRVDLAGESVQDAARALQVTPNHASVMLHRARKELKARLEAFCGECADGACLDCDCDQRQPPRS